MATSIMHNFSLLGPLDLLPKTDCFVSISTRLCPGRIIYGRRRGGAWPGRGAGPHEAYCSNLESTQKYYTSFVALPFDRTNLKRSLISQAFLGPSGATEYGGCTTRV
ncbi:unnamed protein product [Calypogeia fissa]